MATFLLLLQAATAAQTATPLRTLGLSSLRDTKVDALWSAMLAIKTYVGGLASALDATSATALIQAAGLLVANPKTHAKDLLSATYVPATGVVQVSVNGMLLLGKKRIPKTTTFTYSWSADGGKKDGRACGLRALGSAGRGVAPGQRWRPRVGPLLRALPPHHEEPRPGLASGP